MGLFKPDVDKKTQLFLRNNRKFKFRKLPLENGALVIKEDTKYMMAWPHYYGAEIMFRGYKNMPADTITLCHDRDMILDPFKKITEGTLLSQKPQKNDTAIKKWLAQIATNMRHIYSSKRETHTTADAIFWIIASIDILMAIGWAIRYFTG